MDTRARSSGTSADGHRCGSSLGPLARSGLAVVLVSAIGVQRSLVRQADASPGADSRSETRLPDGDVHALARLEPAIGADRRRRPARRSDRADPGRRRETRSTPGQLLAILEGHDQALAQLALAEAQKARADHQRELQKQKLALEREQFDKLQKAKLESAAAGVRLEAALDEIDALYKRSAPTRTCRARTGSTLDAKYLGPRTRTSRTSSRSSRLRDRPGAGARPAQARGRGARRQEPGPRRARSPDRAGPRGPSPRPRSTPRSAARCSRSWPTRARSAAARCSSWATSRPWSAIAEVYQADVPRLKVGDPATVQVLDQSVTGKVTPDRLGRGQEPARQPRPPGTPGPSGGEGDDPPGRPDARRAGW